MRCPACHRRLASGAVCPVHGGQPQPALLPEPLPLPAVPGLRGASLLGTGGFSHVFTAYREEDGREVAVKMGLTPHPGLFAHEAAALRRVGAPTAPELLQHGTAGGHPFLVLEALRGQTLAAWMSTLPGNGTARLPQVRELLAGLCAALERVHAVGLAHRDLKPENIFLREGGTLSLLDFGLARFLEGPEAEASAQDVRSVQRLGTPLYMAPEQCLDAREAGAAADLYALGILLFELLTGAPPFTGSVEEIRHGHVSLRPPSVSAHAGVPAGLDEVLRQCLAKNPAERFSRASHVLDAFEAACQLTDPLGTVPPPASEEERPPREGLRMLAILGLRTEATVDAVLTVLEAHGGLLVRSGAWGSLAVFPERLSAEAGLRAGALAARKLTEEGTATAILHLAEVYVRPGVNTPRVAGAALSSPERWWPGDGPPGEVRVTAEARARLGPGATHEGPGGEHLLAREAVALPQNTGPAPLVGREALLDGLCAEALRCLEARTPGLCVLTGETGHGKTRLLEALAARLEAPGRIRVLRLRALPPDSTSPDALQQALWDAAALRLRGPLGTAASSGAQRHVTSRALAEGLRQSAREAPCVVLLDDAHLADPTSLDTLEMATLTGTHAPLWILLAARPSLRGLRPHFGERSAHVSHAALPPLPPDASRALLLHLLRPVELIPEPVLARLEHLAQGVPLSLVELTGALRTAGALRASPGGGWYVAPDALLDVSATPLFERLAARALAGLPEVHQVLARLCAVLGHEVGVSRVDAAMRHLEARQDTGPRAAWDAGAGLERLVRAGLMQPVGPGRFAFRHPLLREALEAAVPSAPRRALHAAALHSLSGTDTATQRRRAHHAAGCGAHEEAARAFLALAEEARTAHLLVEAEQHYTRALALLPEGEEEPRAQALAGRGRVRHRLQLFREGLADLAAARALAVARGDETRVVDLLLEEATARDWMEDVEGSSACAREALERIERLDDPRLSLRCTLARGRLHVRLGEWEPAARALRSAAEGAEWARDHETHVVALAMLGSTLTFLEQTPEAARCFDEALVRCERAGDTLQRAATYTARVLLWLKRGDVPQMEEDLRHALSLGRELGHAQVERWATFNLAEVLYMQGRAHEALPLAQRAHELGVRFFQEHPVPLDALLVARIQLALGDLAEAARQLRWIEARCAPESLPPTAIMRRMVQLTVQESTDGAPPEANAWQLLVEEARACASADEMMELLLQAAQRARRKGQEAEARQWLEQAHQAVEGAPLWRARLEALRAPL
ncbi:serine/threonine-protein kinase [Stigmatella hybrida]|uniref:serine/threonine-protein kinase n=1 Tax=Stigmatella hybrida TaxID=394097 RepID=UPI001CDA787A